MAALLFAASVRPPTLLWWMHGEGTDRAAVAVLRQEIGFTRTGLHLCRILENRSPQEIIVNRQSDQEDDRDQFGTWFFGRDGRFIYPDRPSHPSRVPPMPPPPPGSPDMTLPFQLLAPHEELRVCTILAPAGPDLFQVVSRYTSDLLEEFLPADFARGRIVLLGHDYVTSGVCVVRMSRRTVHCTGPQTYRIEARPAASRTR